MSDCTQAVPYIMCGWVADTVLRTVPSALMTWCCLFIRVSRMATLKWSLFSLCTHSQTTNVISHTHKQTHKTVPVLMFIITFLFTVQMYGDLLYHIQCTSNVKLLFRCSHGYDSEALQCCTYRTVGPVHKMGWV